MRVFSLFDVICPLSTMVCSLVKWPPWTSILIYSCLQPYNPDRNLVNQISGHNHFPIYVQSLSSKQLHFDYWNRWKLRERDRMNISLHPRCLSLIPGNNINLGFPPFFWVPILSRWSFLSVMRDECKLMISKTVEFLFDWGFLKCMVSIHGLEF